MYSQVKPLDVITGATTSLMPTHVDENSLVRPIFLQLFFWQKQAPIYCLYIDKTDEQKRVPRHFLSHFKTDASTHQGTYSGW